MIERKNELPKKVKEYCEQRASINLKFASYLERYKNGEILERVFAFRELTKKPLQIFEVMRRVSNGETYYVRDLWFYQLAGYRTYFCEKEKWYEYKDSMKCEYGMYTNCINSELLLKTKKYKYCAYRNGIMSNVVDYLNLYAKYPGLELMSKLGIKPSVSLLKKAEKDKIFCKFLYSNNYEIDIYNFNVKEILYAYNHNVSLFYARRYFEIVNYFKNDYLEKFLVERKDKIKKYCLRVGVDLCIYLDYYNACKSLKLDMLNSKNMFPIDFRRMHDLRINQYSSLKEKENLVNMKKFYKNFEKVSAEYSFLNMNGKYVIFVAPTIDSLKVEGSVLRHCVGRFGYDKKMSDKKSLILFIRRLDNIDKPFVTMEYSLIDNKILQLYGYGDSKPDDEVVKFSQHWLEFANDKMKQFNKKVA